MTDTERELLMYALNAPNWRACKTIILDVLHGVTGADNCDDIRAGAIYRAEAKVFLGDDYAADAIRHRAD